MYPSALLGVAADKLTAKADALAQQLQQQLGLEPLEVQEVISTQPSVLMFKPEALAHKLQEMAQRLGLAPQETLRLWLRQRTLINLSTPVLDAKLAELSRMLRLQHQEVAKLIKAQPSVLVSGLERVQQRLAAVQECLNDWTPQQLGQALVQYPSVLTYRPETLRHKWWVINAYANTHPPSWRQLQERRQLPAVCNFFTRAMERIRLLEYVMVLQQGCSISSAVGSGGSGSSVSRSTKVTKQHQHETKGSLSSSDGAAALIAAATAAAAAEHVAQGAIVDGMPLLLYVTNAANLQFERLVDCYYPGFWEWQVQQLQSSKQGAADLYC